MGNQKQTLDRRRLHGRKSLDTGSLDPSDANEDADGDGLTNACEYRWSVLLETVRENGLTTHGESAQALHHGLRLIQTSLTPTATLCQMVGKLAMHVHGT